MELTRKAGWVGLLVLFILGLLLAGAPDSTALVQGSKHDLSSATGGWGNFQSSNETEICIFCHTPHSSIAQDTAGNRLPLWNRSISRNEAGYSLYSSSTLQSSPGQPTGTSLLCLSCHDGISNLNTLVNYATVPVITMVGTTSGDQLGDVYKPGFPLYPGANIGEAYPASPNIKNLSNDHPISIQYTDALASADGALNPPSGGLGTLKLFGAANNVLECATCHDAHEEGDSGAGTFPFLRMSNTASQMCLTCHIK